MAGNVCWFEITSNDPVKSGKFFSELFGWGIEHWQQEYYNIKTGGSPEGGLMKKPPQAPTTDVYIYVQVDDIDATLTKVSALGGKPMLPKTEIPGVGHIAFFADPDGNPIGIYRPRAK